MRLLLKWFLHALALLLVSWFVPGFHVTSIAAALIAALVIGLLNVTLGLLLKIITFPLSILTFGIFFLVINAFVIKLASGVVPGFYVMNFTAAFVGAIALALLHIIFGMLESGD
jgi:putative membrane protein